MKRRIIRNNGFGIGVYKSMSKEDQDNVAFFC